MARRRRPLPPVSHKQLLEPATADRLRRLLIAGATRDEAAALVGITRRRLDTRLADQLADVRVGQGRQGRSRARAGEDNDPDPEEIRRRAAIVRAGWTEEEREAKWCPGFSGPPEQG